MENNIKLSKIKPEDDDYIGGNSEKRIFVGRLSTGLPVQIKTNLGWVDQHETFTSSKGVIFPEEMKIIIYVCENFGLFYDNIQE
jgi:hypothetical protein